MPSFSDQLLQQFANTSALEWIAALFGMASVLLSRANHIALYPTGIVSTAIYAYMWSQTEAKLYADALLNLYYLSMSIYGWIAWARHRGDADALKISRCSRPELWIAAGIASGAWTILYTLLLYTPSDVPVWDSFVSATAWSGMWLLARRKLENWVLLNISNLAAIPLFAYKGYYVTMLLTIFLFAVAVSGYLKWRRLLQEREAQNDTTVSA
jgi:nicotinamide mononucleotide transporter